MEENGEINEFGLKKILDVYEEIRVPIFDTLIEVNRKENIIGFEEEKIEGQSKRRIWGILDTQYFRKILTLFNRY